MTQKVVMNTFCRDNIWVEICYYKLVLKKRKIKTKSPTNIIEKFV